MKMMELKEDILKTFEMTNLSFMNYFFKVEVKQQNGEIFISQKKYTETFLKKFTMYHCKSVTLHL